MPKDSQTMNDDRIKATAAQINELTKAQLRPAWLWDGEGTELIWQNDAARVFMATEKNSKLKLAKQPVPIAGQVRRLLRLGTTGLTSLSRVRFLAGGKPLSITCSCTPILLDNKQSALMIVGVDPVKRKHVKKLAQSKLIKEQHQTLPSSTTKKTKNAKEKGASTNQSDNNDIKIAPNRAKNDGTLSKLIERLNNGSTIYEPLKDFEEIDPKLLAHNNSKHEENTPSLQSSKDKGQNESFEKAPELWRVTGKGFTGASKTGRNQDSKTTHYHKDNSPKKVSTLQDKTKNDESDMGETSMKDETELEQIARYNFKELGRILEKRIEAKPSPKQNRSTLSRTIALSDEMLVLNRLPIGILIFKDQNILFTNRAMADLVGSPSISELKKNGLAAIFPRIENPNSSLGPVLSIMGTDGSEVKVSARLQGINWHGTPALMLSAQAKPDAVGKNKPSEVLDASKSFSRSVAMARNEGFIEINRNGIISNVSRRGAELFEQSTEEIVGKAFSDFIDHDEQSMFRNFLEQKSKTAETTLPRIELLSKNKNMKFEIFADGRAGFNSGYFGIFAPCETTNANSTNSRPQDQDATILLNRLSQGIRRPLNTILGFSELIETEAFGKISNPRYVEYARDIKTAGNEISRLADELDEYALLENQNVAKPETDFDLRELLAECLSLIRPKARERRVILRDAIALNLPNIIADRASLRQAVLNLLASAIAQTPAGAKVILSAQMEDDGSLGIHVRDSSTGPQGIDEKFVIFKEQDEKRGETMIAMKSTIGLALTRSLVSVNSCALYVDPSAGEGTLMSLVVPANLVVR